MKASVLAGMLAGFAGGIVAALIAIHLGPSEAAAAPLTVANMAQRDGVTAEAIRLVDAQGRKRAELAMSPDGAPALFFYDTVGRNRLVLGLYSQAEGEFPFVVLNDTQQHAAGIFRLFSAHQAPVVVLKSAGQDRSIYGLNPNTLEPFLVNYQADGKKAKVFGEY